MTFRSFLLLLAAFILCPLHLWAVSVTVIKHDNSEIKGELLSVSADRVILKNRRFPREEVKRILYHHDDAGAEDHIVPAVRSSVPKEKLLEMARLGAKKYPDAGYVTLIDHATEEYIDAKNSVSTYHGAYVILKDDFKNIARIAHYVNEARMRFKVVFGRIIYPDGREFYMDPSKDLVKSVTKDQGAAFFSSNSSVLFYNFPNPTAGCIIEYKYRTEYFLPYVEDHFSGRFAFNSDQPVLATRIDVIMPEDKPLYWVTRNMDKKESKPSVSVKNGRKTYTWSFGEFPPIIEEPSMPALADVAKRVYYCNHKDLDFLFAWKRKMLEKNMKVTPAIKRAVSKILKDVPATQTDIVRRIYHWVQTNIRYVSVKSGSMSGMAGHPAEETLANKFGDCVDKSVLFCTLLRAAGIEAYPIAIRTNPGPEMETRLPLFDANHSISEVIIDGRSFILDTTTTNYSFPSFRIDDHGVPVINAFTKRVFRSPVPPPEQNQSSYRRVIDVSPSGTFTVRFRGDYTGPRSAGLRGYYKTVPKKDLKKIFQGLARRDAPDAELIDFRIENIYDLTKNVFIEYSFSSHGFLKKAGNLYIMRNNSTLPYRWTELALSERKYPIEYMSSIRRQNNDTYNLAAGWSVKFAPEPVEISDEYIHYKASWTVEGDKIIFRNRFDRKKRIVPVKDYKRYKADIQKILDFEKQNVILQKAQPKNYADLLILRDGVEIDGEFIGATGRGLTFENKDGQVNTYDDGKVLSVEIARTGARRIQSLNDILDADLAAALSARASAGDYPGALKAVLLDKHSYRLNKDGSYTWTSRMIVRVLKEKGKAAGFDNWNFDPKTEKFRIDFARTINGDRVCNLSSRTIKTALTQASLPEYQRKRNTKFALPEVKVGSVIDYQVSRRIKPDVLLHPFSLALERGSSGDSHTIDAGNNESWKPLPCSFYPAVPLVRKELLFDVPKSFRPQSLILNNRKAVIRQSKFTRGNRVVYSFYNEAPLPARLEEDSQPPVADFHPLVLFSAKTSWNELFRKAAPAFAPAREDIAAARRKLGDIKKKYGEISLESIYKFVALEILHPSIGIRDYSAKPKRVAEIIKNRRAGALDSAWLLLCLLRADGIKAELGLLPRIWFSRRCIKSFPSLDYFSIPVVRCIDKKRTRYLWASTSKLSMPDSCVYFEGRDLLVFGDGAFRFDRIPVSGRNLTSSTLAGRLDESGRLSIDNMLTVPQGADQTSFRGLRSVLRKKWKFLAEQIVNSIHPNAALRAFSFENIDDLGKDVKISLSARIPNYCNKAGSLLFFRLPSVRYGMPDSAVPGKRLYSDIDLGHPKTVKRTYRIRIPNSLKLFYLPRSLRMDEGALRYRAVLEMRDDTLLFTEEYANVDAVFPKERYPAYQFFFKRLADFADEYIIFEKKQ